MKSKLFLLAISLSIGFTANAKLTADDCIDIERSVGINVTDAMVSDFGLEENDIVLEKTKMSLVFQEKVTKPMALYFALQDKKDPALGELSLKELMEIYATDNPTNLIIKFDYVNKSGKHNVLLSSHFISEGECTIRYNGYIIVKREF